MAGAGAVGPGDRRDPEPARRLDPHRRHAVRPRPALFALADHAVVAADLVHADRLGGGAVHAAVCRRLVPALGAGMGTRRRRAVAAVRRRPYRRSDQAGLSRYSCAPRARAADPGAEAGTGAVVHGDAGMMPRVVPTFAGTASSRALPTR